MTTPRRPPSLWRSILSRVLPRRDRDALVRELDEAYLRRVAESGPRSAKRWYREEVMAFVVNRPGLGLQRLKYDYGEGTMDGIRQIAVVLKSLRRSPGFTALAVITLALGIGANALIFAIADRAVFRPLPFPEPDRIVRVLDGWGTALGPLEILQREMDNVEAIGGAIDAQGMTMEPDGAQARRVSVSMASPEYFEALGVEVAEGRRFLPEESEPGRGQVALLAYDFFEESYGGDPAAIGATVVLDAERYEIVGVLPDGFDMPSARNDIWIPTTMDSSPANVGYHWGMGVVTLVARLAPGATPEMVRQEVVRVQEEIRLANPLWTPPPNFWDDARVVPLQESRSQWAKTPVFLLLGALGVVLLVVCANVANLLLSRGLARQRDFAVRTALGAGRRQLAATQLVEVSVLAAAGTALGLLMAGLGLDLLRPVLPADVPGMLDVALDLRVIAFTVAVAMGVALTAGAVPALRVGGRSPQDFLRESGRGRSASRGRRRVTSLLVAGQMAAAVVLVTGAGLLGRSLQQMSHVDPGFESEGRVVARADVPPGLGHDREARAQYFRELQEAVSGDPAIRDVALGSSIPFGSETWYVALFIVGVTDDPNDLPSMVQRPVSANYFDVAGVPLRSGRLFDDRDRVGSPLVVIVDQQFVDQFFPGQNALGQIVRYPWRGAPDMEIIGVVGATGSEDLAEEPEPTIWIPLDQLPGGLIDHAMVVATHAGNAEAALGAIQTRVRDFEPRMAVSEMAPYPELLRDSLAVPRLLTLLLLIFAGSTLILGCVGVYGVAAFSARERVREIGVRMTLGADPSEIRGRFLKEGLWLAIPGGVAGLVVAAASGRVLNSFLYEVSPMDPLTFLVTPLILVAAALLAVYVPARRATRVDPASVLREG